MTLFRDEFASIEKFLGRSRASGSPFDLLGVPPRDLTAPEIVSGLESRLVELDRHPESRTPPADEVRLALHAAAAQLLDASTRAELIAYWKDASNGAWTEEVAPSPLASTIGTPARLALEGDAVMAMALEGGWNARSLERLMMFAHARSLTAEDVAQVVQRLSRHDAPPRPTIASSVVASPSIGAPAAPNVAPRGPGLHREQPAPSVPAAALASTPAARAPVYTPKPRTFELTEDEIQRQSAARLKLAITGIGCGSIVLFAVTLGIVVAFRTTPEPVPPTPEQPADATPTQDTTAAKPQDQPRPRPQDVSTDNTASEQVVRLLDAAAKIARDKPADAVAQFSTALGHAEANWPRWKPDELAAVHNAIIELLYRLPREGDSLQRAAERLGQSAHAASAAKSLTPQSLQSAVWSVGVCARVLRERDLSAAITGPARLAAAEYVGSESDLGDGGFADGVQRALAASTPRLVIAPSAAAWKAWISLVGAASPEPAARGRMIVAALDAMLAARANPLDDAAAVESIGALASSLTWRAEEQSRPWIFRWFDSASISTPALHALTAAIASQSSAEGVNPSMVLSAAATAGQRSDLRAKFAQVWSDSPGGVRTELQSKWLAAVTREIDQPVQAAPTTPPRSELAAKLPVLVDAILTSRLSEAAAWMAAGDQSKATDVLDGPASAVSGAAKITGPETDPLGGTNDGAWAVRYLASLANGPVRLEMLKQAETAPELTALECEVVASEAIRGLPASVRQAARRVVIHHRSLPGMLNAVLNLAPAIAPGPDNQQFLEELTGGKLPPIRDARWRESARRVLVEQLLERATGRGEYGAVDLLGEFLGQSYRARIAAFGGADGLPAAIDGPVLARLASVYRGRWEREAERTPPSGKEHATVGQIRQRASGRAGLATNIVQQFTADQTAAVEFMAYVIVAEEPSRSQSVQTIMNDWAKSRREAKHVFDQMLVAERAMLLLWRVRMKENAA